MATAATVFRDYETDGVPASGRHKPRKPDIRQLLAGYESIINAFLSNGGLIFASLSSLNSSLNYAANTMAWVLGDATVANNGIYRKIGGSGTGSWTRVADLPFSFIIASDVGAGTANAIQATTSLPVSSSALVWSNIFEANTSSPVTISFNGGSALTVKTNAGNNVAAGGLVAGMIVMGIVSGSTFRLVSDQVSSAIVAAAEAAQAAAEAAAASINILTVADRTVLKGVDSAIKTATALAERTREGVFYPRLISGLAPSTAAAMAADTGEYIYVPSTDDPATVWIRQGAELRGFWSNSATPAYVHRLRERVMIGDSAGFDCSTTPDANTGAAWLHEIKPSATHGCGYMESHGRVVSTGANGAQFVGATRIAGAAGVEGYGGIFHVRNESTNDRDCWGVYIDTVRGSATAGNMAGMELDIANCSGVSDARYLPHGFEGQTVPAAWSYGLALASGGDIRVNPDALPVSFALGIINNGASFHTGIVFRSNALELDGAGYGEAVAMASKHKIGWHLSGGESSYITSVATTLASGTRALFIDSGFELRRNGDDSVYFRSLGVASTANLFEVVGVAAGSSPIIRAAGTDTNLNVVLQPKNAGVLQLTYAAAIAADIASNRRVRIRVAGADIDLLGVLV